MFFVYHCLHMNFGYESFLLKSVMSLKRCFDSGLRKCLANDDSANLKDTDSTAAILCGLYGCEVMMKPLHLPWEERGYTGWGVIMAKLLFFKYWILIEHLFWLILLPVVKQEREAVLWEGASACHSSSEQATEALQVELFYFNIWKVNTDQIGHIGRHSFLQSDKNYPKMVMNTDQRHAKWRFGKWGMRQKQQEVKINVRYFFFIKQKSIDSFSVCRASVSWISDKL